MKSLLFVVVLFSQACAAQSKQRPPAPAPVISDNGALLTEGCVVVDAKEIDLYPIMSSAQKAVEWCMKYNFTCTIYPVLLP